MLWAGLAVSPTLHELGERLPAFEQLERIIALSPGTTVAAQAAQLQRQWDHSETRE